MLQDNDPDVDQAWKRQPQALQHDYPLPHREGLDAERARRLLYRSEIE